MTLFRLSSSSKFKATRIVFLLLTACLLPLLFIAARAKNIVAEQQKDEPLGVKKVVLDAGHGGKDPGALGADGLLEKDVALYITLEVGKLIKKHHPEIEVIYTRDTDVFIELHQRAKIANEAKADLFISIHADAAANKQAYGTETFCLGLHANARNLETAKRENAAILYEDGQQEHYEGFDPNADESYIIFQLYQSTFLDQSQALADSIQGEFSRLGRRNRGTKQAGFLVLYKTTMPSILVETGFVTNPDEGEFLRNDANKEKLARAIYQGFAAYNRRIIENQKKMSEAVESPVEAKVEASEVQVTQPEESAPKEEEEVMPSEDEFPHKVNYAVQIATSMKSLSENPEFAKIESVWSYQDNGVYKYVVGKFATQNEAADVQKNLRASGHPQAFVVVFNQQGERITPKQAQQLLQGQ